MRIFVSWSGERSHGVAEALRNWLPHVIQGLQPWLSSNDIDKGARWAADIASHLEESRVGIICLTPEKSNQLGSCSKLAPYQKRSTRHLYVHISSILNPPM
jgi:hypothetical protein